MYDDRARSARRDTEALNAIGLSAAATMVVLLVVRARRNLRELATAEPATARE